MNSKPLSQHWQPFIWSLFATRLLEWKDKMHCLIKCTSALALFFRPGSSVHIYMQSMSSIRYTWSVFHHDPSPAQSELWTTNSTWIIFWAPASESSSFNYDFVHIRIHQYHPAVTPRIDMAWPAAECYSHPLWYLILGFWFWTQLLFT